MQGEVLFEQAKKVLALAQQAEIAVKTMGKDVRGHIGLGTLNSIGVQLITPIIGRLLKFNPKLSVKILYEDLDLLLKGFLNSELDAVIIPEIDPEVYRDIPLEKKFLMREELWLVASGKMIDVPKQISIHQLRDFPVILFSRELPAFEAKLKETLQRFSIEPVCESSNVGTLKRIVESGLGWGFLPASSIRKQIKAGRMVQVQVKDFNYAVDFYYYYKTVSEKKALLDVFFQALEQQERAL
jgi:DNA-binding transcriptional LysR family regulator